MTTFRHRVFDVEIERTANAANLDWPEGERFKSDSGLGGNRHYEDLRRQPWWLYKEALAYERAFIRQFEAAADDDARADLIEALDEDEDAGCLCGLDPGVASCVLALSASRCAPFTSCNAGAFDGGHLESYPLVSFFVRPPLVVSLLSCAEEAKVGLLGYGGALQVYARRITQMIDFAEVLHRRRRELAAIRLVPERAGSSDDRQLSLFDD
ncbi:hypothetical protein [Phenylobacterium sp.]|uniref:hypothetical protein n=1 Tax=Phenylobacterium sp. TaxID=1871053 RepID=UPI002FC644B6